MMTAAMVAIAESGANTATSPPLALLQKKNNIPWGHSAGRTITPKILWRFWCFSSNPWAARYRLDFSVAPGEVIAAESLATGADGIGALLGVSVATRTTNKSRGLEEDWASCWVPMAAA